MFKLGTKVSSSRFREQERKRERAMLRLIHPRFIKSNQRMRESWWKLLLCSFVHDASPTPEIPVSRPLFQEFAISCPASSTNLHLPPSIFHGSTPFVRSQNSRSRLLPQRIEFFRTTLSFSLSLPSGIQSRRGDRRRGERWNVGVGSKVKGETRVRGDGGRIRWSDVKANFHEPGRKCTQADAQSGRKSYKAYLTTDPLIFNFRPAKWSGFGELASACRRLVSMEIQLGKLFQPRRYRSHHRSPRGEKYRLHLVARTNQR